MNKEETVSLRETSNVSPETTSAEESGDDRSQDEAGNESEQLPDILVNSSRPESRTDGSTIMEEMRNGKLRMVELIVECNVEIAMELDIF